MRKVFFAVLALIVLCTAVAFATDGSVTNVKLSPVYVANAYIPTSAYLKSNDYISVSAVYNSTKGTYLWTYSFKPTGLNLYKAAGNTTPTSVANDIAAFTLSFLSPATSVIKAGTISVAGTTATVNTTGNDLTFNFGSNIYQNSGASISFETCASSAFLSIAGLARRFDFLSIEK